MKKLFSLVVLMCLLGVNSAWAGDDFIFFGTDLNNIFHNIVTPRSSEDEVATVNCYFRYYNPNGNYLKTDDYVNYKFKAEIIGDLTMDEGSALQNGQERGDFTAMFQIKFKGRGGAIIVTATNKNNGWENNGWSTFFVITAPYIGNQTWDFFTEPNTGMTYYPANNVYPYWIETTKFSGHPDRPIQVVDMNYDKANGRYNDGHDNIDGTNARYIPATAGLVFNCGDECFGVDDNSKINPDNNQPYYSKKYVTWGKTGSKLTIPHLKGGTYVRIWWDCINAGEFGGHFLADGLLDLEGNPINSQFTISGVTDYGMCQGNTIFKVAGNSNTYRDVSLTLNDDGWNDIYKIQVMDEYETDMILADNTGDNRLVGHTVVYNNEFGTIVHDGSGATRRYSGHSGVAHIQRARTLEWEVSSQGNVTYTTPLDHWSSGHGSQPVYYDDLVLNITGGSGNIKIVQREKFDGYVLDKNETWIAVGTYTQQTYPYTWDFMDWNMKQKRMLTVLDDTNRHGFAYGYWNTASNNVRSLETHEPVDATKGSNNFVWNNMKVDRPLFAQGSQLSYRVYDEMGGIDDIVAFKEAEGLRMKQFWGDELGVGPTYDGEISLDGDFLKYNPTVDGHKLKITIPNVPTKKNNEDMWIFVKSSVAPQSVYAATDKATPVKIDASVPDKCRLQNDVKAYKITSAGDVEILFTEATSISAIGVTHIFKNINVLGYATESRDVDIDHEYEGVFTQNDVNAFCIQTYNNDGFTYEYKGVPEVRMSARVHTVPKNTGIILYVEKEDNYDFGKEFKVPLFYPACNNKEVDSDELIRFRNNWLAPWVTEDAHVSETVNRLDALRKNGDNGIDYGTNNDECTKFVMSRQHYVYYKPTNSNSELITDLVDDVEVEAFYRMRLNSGVSGTSNTMGANKAYLLIPTSKMPKALWNNGNGEGTPGQAKEGVIFMDLEKLFGEEIPNIPTDIVSFDSNESLNDNSNIYHTLSGMQIEGKPTAKGVYIKNGKKVFIK